jgi:hypothetical protein
MKLIPFFDDLSGDEKSRAFLSQRSTSQRTKHGAERLRDIDGEDPRIRE